jgi:hypothetical protein
MESVMTHQEIMNLKVGDYLQNTMDIVAFTEFKEVKPNAVWSKPRKVVAINFRNISKHTGRAYVGFETEFGASSSISTSIMEGENHYRIA